MADADDCKTLIGLRSLSTVIGTVFIFLNASTRRELLPTDNDSQTKIIPTFHQSRKKDKLFGLV